ncbi:MAG: M20 family metallopeptidase [Chloroflexi bacterium]|nr:M20 family metallopeptidase [Chloroflexota bacterium]
MSQLIAQFHDYLKSHVPAMTSLLTQLVTAESPTSVPEAQVEVQAILIEQLRQLDYDVQHIPGKTSGGMLYARPAVLAPHQPKQLLLGHCDTVWPLGTLAEIPVVQQGNIMRGPGIYDMKAGLTQMIFALRALREFGIEPAVAPLVFITSDEETGSHDSVTRIRQLATQVQRVLVLEPSLGAQGKLKTARKGVGQFHITAYGWAAHAGLDPDRGASAIVAMSHVIQKLAALNDLEQGISVNVGTVEGGERPNVVAPECKIEVDVRVPRTADVRPLEEAIRQIKPNLPIVVLDIQGGINRPPLERTPRNQELWRLAQEVGRELGLELEQAEAGGGSDGNFTSEFAATLDGLGAVGDGAHARHEFIYIDKLAERAALLAGIMARP